MLQMVLSPRPCPLESSPHPAPPYGPCSILVPPLGFRVESGVGGVSWTKDQKLFALLLPQAGFALKLSGPAGDVVRPVDNWRVHACPRTGPGGDPRPGREDPTISTLRQSPALAASRCPRRAGGGHGSSRRLRGGRDRAVVALLGFQ